MKNFNDFFANLLGKDGKRAVPQPHAGRRPIERVKPALGAERMAGVPYKRGDFIGKDYEVCGLLGQGGFGVVYLAYSHRGDAVFALKTFRDEYLQDTKSIEHFRKEAQVWVDLERHPHLVQAWFVDEIAGRLYIGMEYIAPDDEGVNSLEGHLERRPPDLAQSLLWAIQFCHGMEYAYSHGIRAHRDVKPANILISQGQSVKISDFGLAGVLGSARREKGISLGVQQGRVGLSCTLDGAGFGTPTHMPPEQFTNASDCDERSDIYAFGIVLYQMATAGKLPFLAPLPRDRSEEEMARFWRNMHSLHSKSPVPSVDSPLFPVIERCLRKQPGKRCQTFVELRNELEPLLRRETGEVIKPPELQELEAWEWGNKAFSVFTLGHFEEAIRCCDRALELGPREAMAWNIRGASLDSLGRLNEAVRCYDRALELDPKLAMAWFNKGLYLDRLGRLGEALRCYEKAVVLVPRDAQAWIRKASVEEKLGRRREAAHSYKRFIALAPGQYPDHLELALQRLRELGGR